VPGDRVRLEAGDRIPADGTLVEARGALLDESVLTGESVPIDKEDRDEAFSGTLLVRGKTYLDVTRTGTASAIFPSLRRRYSGRRTLERRVDQLGRQIARCAGARGRAHPLGVVRRRRLR
jgi:Ca2+-transporting ATPase